MTAKINFRLSAEINPTTRMPRAVVEFSDGEVVFAEHGVPVIVEQRGCVLQGNESADVADGEEVVLKAGLTD